MSSHEILQFDDLDLHVGNIVQIHPNPKESTRFDCTYIGGIPGEAVIVSVSPTGEFPVVKEGQKVAIRTSTAIGIAMFPTTVLFISEIPTLMVYLDIPQAIKHKSVRTAMRVEVSLPILVSSTVDRSLRGITGKIADISVSGAGLLLERSVGEVGEKVEIKGKFEVAGIQRLLSIEVMIRSKIQRSNGDFFYGVEFLKGSEDKMLVLFGYVFNAMAIGKIQSVR
ncbi:PilZ domain-containing protein [Teredinibacter sp. KSP-S5-2]|uniref:PilZ domain-containing protein n=1 Tax=Teredinibacter sp. KSP-S5-2 TaxID=3034506 RepID=UPI0029348771|nr:PilZ domain-containing protein [Teredinibacter sp. KSP-S5-2]WNO10153.1 PilZ domain-containing protein [Teredinibacter sp. KSP-S5-2]